MQYTAQMIQNFADLPGNEDRQELLSAVATVLDEDYPSGEMIAPHDVESAFADGGCGDLIDLLHRSIDKLL